MKLKNSGYSELADNIRSRNSRIIIYGAGMIGQILIPFIIEKYQLLEYVECYVDMDERKKGKKIAIGLREYEVRQPEFLKNISGNTVILITNSKCYPIIQFLDRIEALDNIDCYIVPMMQMIEQRPMIPKVIHYCWFGGKKLPGFLERCIESWELHCPEYKIIRWDETNYDVEKYDYIKYAFHNKKFGFITDVARLDILYQHGGIYLDTDVKLLKTFDGLLYNKGFVGVEKWGNINTGGGVGVIPRHPMIREMLDYRLEIPFIFKDGSLNIETNGLYETIPFIKHGMRIDNTLQTVNDMTVYPASVFHPYDYMSCEEKIEENTVSVHYFYGGWMEERDKRNRFDTQNNYRELKKRMKMWSEGDK